MLDKAKALRTHQTDAEQRMWYHLRAHRFMGLKFKRQKLMGRYIVDFVCMERGLIVELDGGQHADAVMKDQRRDAWLRGQGYTGAAVLEQWGDAKSGRRVGADSDSGCPLPQPLSRRRERGRGEQLCRNSSIFWGMEIGIPCGIGFEDRVHDGE